MPAGFVVCLFICVFMYLFVCSGALIAATRVSPAQFATKVASPTAFLALTATAQVGGLLLSSSPCALWTVSSVVELIGMDLSISHWIRISIMQ